MTDTIPGEQEVLQSKKTRQICHSGAWLMIIGDDDPMVTFEEGDSQPDEVVIKHFSFGK